MAGPFSNAATSIGGAVSDLFSASAHKTKADMYRIESEADLLKGRGAELEGQSYTRAHELALTNKAYTEQSTAIQEAQASRDITRSLGTTRASIGASGLQESGSALDVLADSARQGELHKQVVQQQGLITEEGFQESADVYENMTKAAGIAVEGAQLASKEHLMAADAEETAATGAYIGAGIKGLTAVASLFEGFGGGGMPGLDPGIGSTV